MPQRTIRSPISKSIEGIHSMPFANISGHRLDPSETNLFDFGSELLTHRAVDQSLAVFSKGVSDCSALQRGCYLASGRHCTRVAHTMKPRRRFFEATDINPADPAPYLFLGKVQNSEINTQDGFLERMARFAKLEPSNARANNLYAAALWNDPA